MMKWSELFFGLWKVEKLQGFKVFIFFNELKNNTF